MSLIYLTDLLLLLLLLFLLIFDEILPTYCNKIFREIDDIFDFNYLKETENKRQLVLYLLHGKAIKMYTRN